MNKTLKIVLKTLKRLLGLASLFSKDSPKFKISLTMLAALLDMFMAVEANLPPHEHVDAKVELLQGCLNLDRKKAFEVYKDYFVNEKRMRLLDIDDEIRKEIMDEEKFSSKIQKEIIL